MLSLRVLRAQSAFELLQAVLAEEIYADGYWVAVQTRSSILLNAVTAKGARILRIPGLPTTLPVLRSPAAATAPSVSPFLEAMAQCPWRTIAVAPVPASIPWPIMLGATASNEILPVHGAGVLKILAATAVLLGHLLAAARLTRLNDVLIAQAQAMEPWLLAEDDCIIAASPEAWRTVESLWRREAMDLKSGYARLPIALSSATGLDLPLRLPGKTSARMATTTTDFLPPLLTVTFSRSDRPGLAIEKLTGTERKVLSLVLEGMSNRAISEHLGRSIATTQNHVHAILAKLQAGDRRELLIRANHSLRPEPQPVPGLQPMEALPLPPRKLVHSPHQKSESA